MDKMRWFWVGADPGGKGAFGLAFVDVSGSLRCETVSSVDEAAKAITTVGKPLGLGIDAPMWWSAGEGGGRRADARLRKRYGIPSRILQSGSALRGAALLVSRLREAFPGLRITESHPKALLLAMTLDATQFAFRRTYLSHAIRLFTLPFEVQRPIRSGELRPRHARCLITLPGPEAQIACAREIVDRRLSATQAEALARAYRVASQADGTRAAMSPNTHTVRTPTSCASRRRWATSPAARPRSAPAASPVGSPRWMNSTGCCAG